MSILLLFSRSKLHISRQRNKKRLSWRLNMRLNNFRNKWTQFDLTDQPLLALSSCSTYSNQPWPPVISPLRRQHVNVNLVLRPQSLQSTNPQHSITSQSWFYSVIQQTSKLTDIHHSHFNDKVQLHASHCIIQTLLFHSRHKITQADRERERGRRVESFKYQCIFSHMLIQS